VGVVSQILFGAKDLSLASALIAKHLKLILKELSVDLLAPIGGC